MTYFCLSMILLVVLCSLNQAVSEIYNLKTNSTALSCSAEQCLTLSQFAANTSRYLRSNTMLVFLPGTHHLSKVNLTLSNVKIFTMKSDSVSPAAQIECTDDSNIHFSQSQSIHIINLQFIGCGGNQVKQVEEFLVKDTKFEGQGNSGTALELIETTAQIHNSTFSFNRKGSYRLFTAFDSWYGRTVDGFIGGAIIATDSANVIINQSIFEDNRADYGGSIFADNSTINMSGNVSFINNVAIHFGGVLCSNNSVITINASTFNNSFADEGGVLWSYYSIITTESSEFHDNLAANSGGVLLTINSFIRIETSKFDSNSGWSGGAVYSPQLSTITIEESEFYGNDAFWGGVLSLTESNITIVASKFLGNTATLGGVLWQSYSNSNITIEGSGFDSNNASFGGVLYSLSSTITVGDCSFTNNSSPLGLGAVIYAVGNTKIQYYNYLLIDSNLAHSSYAVIYLSNSEFRGNHSGNVTFSNNLGYLVAFNSNITFSGYITFVSNQPPKATSATHMDTFQEGGAITLIRSNILFNGECNLEHNHAANGGAIHSTESKLYVNGNVTIAHNTATGNSGGVHLSTSELNCHGRSTFVLYNNSALHKGGGLHAISSSIRASSAYHFLVSFEVVYTGTRINFTNNKAKFGGGLSLEANAKLYILKLSGGSKVPSDTNTVLFTANSAGYGGAVHVDDDTNSGTCSSNSRTECFFQVLALYDDEYDINRDFYKPQCMYFSKNSANLSGSTLYGGLLDRCAVSRFAEYYKKYAPVDSIEGISYFTNVSVINNISISSRAVQICLCIDNCTYQSHVKVKKGEEFTVSLVAVDQVGQPVHAIIETSLKFAGSGLAEGQLVKNISAKCTNLTFNVGSDRDSETLSLYASDGPCRNVELSRATIDIQFLPCSCPIGLQVSGTNNTNCTCDCHSDISQYVERCDSRTGSIVKEPQSRAWISYINNTDLTGYLVYSNCPSDYCLSTSPPVDLSQPNGADAQCAFNRSSLLCGSCQPGLSLSLGSSQCLQCPNYWPALLIAITTAAILAGIALVTLLLVLNMTVAVGTLNGVIFYANVVYANKSILLPFQGTNFITIFISWLNLEIGIDTCYFPGLDMYIKTWLQLAFPVYIIFLVVLVIIISSYSTKFSNLIGKKDPVATLATLILLSYAKLVEICFKSLSVGIVEYPYGSSEMIPVWLPDATLNYFSAKHIPLFITAVLILLGGLVYTALLFLWQCILYLPKWRIFRWSRNPKIQTFIETYNTPYTPRHRYWTGLLLIVRVVLYLVAAANVSNDPTIALTAVTIAVCCIVLLKGFIVSRRYKKWSTDMLETFFCLNILFFTILTSYALKKQQIHRDVIAYTSVTITVGVLLLIILCHAYTYTGLFSRVKMTKLGKTIDRLFTEAPPKHKPRMDRCSPPPDDGIHRFDDRQLLEELDCPVYTNDYDTIIPLIRPTPVEPTFSVVELSKPRNLAAPNHEEVTNM